MVPFVQAGGGVALAETRYDDTIAPTERELFWGYQITVAGGMQLMPVRNFGFFGAAGYSRAPVIDNLLGDEHDSGGWFLLLGLRAAL